MGLDVGTILDLTTPLEPMRREPRHAAEMVSEALGGEALECLEVAGDWLRVRGEDAYEGWVHRWTCASRESGHDPEFVGRYVSPLGTLWVSDHHAGSPLMRGVPLLRVRGPIEVRGGHRMVRLPWGDEGWLEESSIEGFDGRAWTAKQICDAGRGLLGTPYRWGGRSPLGFDCSGFVQYVFRLADRSLPRDARQQVKVGSSVSLDSDAFEVGDLLFFGEPVDHVAIWAGRGRILHCSGRVRQERLGENPHLAERLCAVRRVLGELDDLGASWWAGRAG